MNKKVASEIAVGVILVLVIVIGGIFWMQNRKQEVVSTLQQPVKQPPVVQKEEQQQQTQQVKPVDETANWQTYTNAKMGIEFKYPSEKIKIEDAVDNGRTISKFLMPTNEKAATSVSANIATAYVFKDIPSDTWSEKSLQSWLDKMKNENNTDSKKQISSLTGITWDCIWSYIPDGKVKTKACYAQSGNNIYQLDFYLNEKMQFFLEKDFDNILSTFKFTK